MIEDAIRSLPNPYPRTDPRGDAWAEGLVTAAREARRLAALPNREAAPREGLDAARDWLRQNWTANLNGDGFLRWIDANELAARHVREALGR